MNQRANFYQSKFSIWLYVSVYYTLLYLPCYHSMLAQFNGNVAEGKKVTNAGLYVSCIGLGLESVADVQKSMYKQKLKKHPLQKWCETGIWKYNTHPNYIGEVLFWIGLYISNFMQLQKSKIAWLGSTVGIGIMLFIMKTAHGQLSLVQCRTYGDDDRYVEYRAKCESLLGYVKFGLVVLIWSLIARFGLALIVKYLF